MVQAFAVFATRGRRVFRVRTTSIIFGAVSSLFVIASPAQQNLVREQARFQILSPGVIRLEYSPHRKFVEAPSVTVLNRQWGAVEVRERESEGWLEISTNKMRMRYRLRSGTFTAANLQISWSDDDGEHHWEPGDKDDKNLGGVPGDIALRVVPGNETGPLSRNGYFVLDDSHTALWNSAGDWVEPRPETDGQDWYFFVYGRDYKSLLHDLEHLLGPIPIVPRYIFGTWFGSRTAYSSDEWKTIIHRFREEHVPLDIVTLDSDSTAKVIWAGRDWDLEQMP